MRAQLLYRDSSTCFTILRLGRLWIWVDEGRLWGVGWRAVYLGRLSIDWSTARRWRRRMR